MAHETEAACLLRTGNLYTHRIGLCRPGSDLVFAGTKHGAFSIYFGDEPFYHFDLEGRWQRAYVRGIHHRKSLDNTVDCIERHREGENLVLQRRRLSFAEAADLDASIRAAAIALLTALGADAPVVLERPDSGQPLDREGLIELLERVASWDAAAWFRHRERYLATYGPLPFLPPDAHQAVILQASRNAGTAEPAFAFTGAAPDARLARSIAEFEEHVDAVRALLGRRLAQCRTLFLAAGDLLQLPFDQLLGYFDVVARRFPIDRERRPKRLSAIPEDAVCLAGVDLFAESIPARDETAWRRLLDRGLGRVNLGIPSGSADLRQRYGAHWRNEDLLRAVGTMKAAGVTLGLIVLAGCGGIPDAPRHETATRDLLTTLELAPADLITLVDAAEVGDVTLGGTVEPLAPADTIAQMNRLKAALRQRIGAKVVVYSRDKEWN